MSVLRLIWAHYLVKSRRKGGLDEDGSEINVPLLTCIIEKTAYLSF